MMKLKLAALVGGFFMTVSSYAADKVLVVISSASQIKMKSGEMRPTGYYLSELTHPLNRLIEAGFDFDVATPGGVVPTVAGTQLIFWGFNTKARNRDLEFVKHNPKIQSPLDLDKLSEENLKDYIGVLVPGGSAPMVDLVQRSSMGFVLRHFHDAKKPTALICHAPAALLSARNETSPWPYAGYEMTSISDFEEKIATLSIGEMDFEKPEASLRNAGGKLNVACNIFRPKVIWDRELITGQNPFAGHELGQKLVEALTKYKSQSPLAADAVGK